MYGQGQFFTQFVYAVVCLPEEYGFYSMDEHSGVFFVQAV
jgi:hypothetical protein